jgi:hypothetical protein
VHSELKRTKKSEEMNDQSLGQMLKLEFVVLDGLHKGKRLWSQLNIVNANPKAVEIAQKELATICRALSLVCINDSIELHDKPMTISVAIQKDAKYGERNVIKNYRPYSLGLDSSFPPKEDINW